ncbi:MAG: head-tail adaptor protein [Pseudoprimorskyibacter sp.]|jgi:head-tail adaptor|nr:head-tail adaptor protein [Pseudoprimorskyibacter sp.]
MKRPHLNRKLVLEAPQAVSDGAGGLIEGWTKLGVVWAEVKPRTGRADDGEAGTLSKVALRITLRASPVGTSSRPQAGQRLREGTRLYRIDAVTLGDPGGRYLMCHTTEEVAA